MKNCKFKRLKLECKCWHCDEPAEGLMEWPDNCETPECIKCAKKHSKIAKTSNTPHKYRVNKRTTKFSEVLPMKNQETGGLNVGDTINKINENDIICKEENIILENNNIYKPLEINKINKNKKEDNMETEKKKTKKQIVLELLNAGKTVEEIVKETGIKTSYVIVVKKIDFDKVTKTE